MNSVGRYYKKTAYQIVYGFYGYAKPKYAVFKIDEWKKTFDTKEEAVKFINNIMTNKVVYNDK
jgi:hypothetical protein